LTEGSKVKKGDLIATVRVVPNEQSLISAKGRVNNIKIRVNNAKIQYNRNKNLFDKGVISRQEFEQIELNYNQSKQDLKNAENDYMIIKRGSASSGSAANTSIIAQMSGTILEIPVKEGDQVIQSNNFNAGTTIASIADMNKMIFEGKVDESEVGKLINGTAIEISLGAIEGKKFPANLNFIAPKGTEEAGAVQFKIKADVALDENYFIRAGYSANAEIVLEKKDSVMSIKDAEGKFDKKFIELGTSDGVNVEIIKGLTMEDEIKVWNKKTEKDDEDQFN
jgi:HlyD family secretion protein